MEDDLGIAWLVKRLVVSKILKSKPAPDINDVDNVLIEANTAGRLVWSSMVPAIVRKIVGSGPLESEMAVEYAHRLGVDLDTVSSKALKQGYNASLGKGIDRSLSWARVAEAWGLDGAQMRSFIGTMPKADYSGDVIPPRSKVALETMINTRADRIRDNETYAMNQLAQQVHWVRMRETGEVGPDITKQWHTALDERTCKVCAPINNKIVRVDKHFSRGVFAPPVHPRCRCWVELLEEPTVVTKRDYKRDEEGKFSTVNTYVPYQYPNKTVKYHTEQKVIGDGAVSPTFYWTEDIRNKLKYADIDRIKSDKDFDPAIPQIWNMIEQKIEPMPKGLPQDFPRMQTAKEKMYLKPYPLTSRQPDDTVTTTTDESGKTINYERPESLLDPKVRWLRENNIVLKREALARDYNRDEDGRFARVNTLVPEIDKDRTDWTPPSPPKRKTLTPYAPAPAKKQQPVALLTPEELKQIERVVTGKKQRAVKPKTSQEFLASEQVRRDRRTLLRGAAPRPQRGNAAVVKKTEEVSQIIYDSKVRAGLKPQKRNPRYINFDMDKTISVAVEPIVIETPMVLYVDKAPSGGTISFKDEPVYAYDPSIVPDEEMVKDKVMIVITGLTMHPMVRKEVSPLGVSEVKTDPSKGIATGEYDNTSSTPIADEGVDEGYTAIPIASAGLLFDLEDTGESMPENLRAGDEPEEQEQVWEADDAEKWLASHGEDPRKYRLRQMDNPHLFLREY